MYSLTCFACCLDFSDCLFLPSQIIISSSPKPCNVSRGKTRLNGMSCQEWIKALIALTTSKWHVFKWIVQGPAKCVIIVTGQWVHTKCLITEMGLGLLWKLTGQCYSVLCICVRVVDRFYIALYSTLKQTRSLELAHILCCIIGKVCRSVSLLTYSWPVEHMLSLKEHFP